MPNSLKHLRETISSIKFLKDRNSALEKELIELLGQGSYEQIIKFYDNAITKLKIAASKLPIGHQYRGTFYIRKPYTIPAEFVEINGSIFMRENLVTWEIRDQGNKSLGYRRAVFKKPEFNTEFVREDGEPVFEE